MSCALQHQPTSVSAMTIYMKDPNTNKININIFDYWSSNSKQDAWFTASLLHGVLDTIEIKPKWINIFSDNEPQYYHTKLTIIMTH